MSLKFIKLLKIIVLYRLLMLLKLMRVTRNNKVIEFLSTHLKLSPDGYALLSNLLKMITLIHFIGCAWGIVGVLTISEDSKNWLRATGIESESGILRYTSSCYWAVMTICTVGYGEINPTNESEVFANVLLMWFGVSVQSYIMSRVTMMFNSTESKDV
jgi:hypothetical protein